VESELLFAWAFLLVYKGITIRIQVDRGNHGYIDGAAYGVDSVLIAGGGV